MTTMHVRTYLASLKSTATYAMEYTVALGPQEVLTLRTEDAARIKLARAYLETQQLDRTVEWAAHRAKIPPTICRLEVIAVEA
jgi:hypothetical protein